ncbi:MAG TPA: hypothetical protein VLZ84_13260 [Asticcacaulis sp.]|nr:hypothetical protein [Asticcacaulis sp.]
MDSYIRTNSGAPLITPWSPRGMSEDKYAAVTARENNKREVESSAMKAFDSPQMQSAETSKHTARDKVQNIVKRLKILRQLFSGNPKEMARAMAQVFKELKAALKEYKAAMDKEIGGSASAIDATMTADMTGANPSVAAPQATDEKPVEAGGEEAAVDAGVAADPPTGADTQAIAEAPVNPPEDRSALYGAIERKVREMAGEDGLDFLKELKGVLKYIEDKLLAPARLQVKARTPDKDTDKAFEDADKELKDLRKDMEDMASDIKHDVPTAGMRLDVAA